MKEAEILVGVVFNQHDEDWSTEDVEWLSPRDAIVAITKFSVEQLNATERKEVGT